MARKKGRCARLCRAALKAPPPHSFSRPCYTCEGGASPEKWTGAALRTRRACCAGGGHTSSAETGALAEPAAAAAAAKNSAALNKEHSALVARRAEQGQKGGSGRGGL